jgi:HAD superfamily hydrolase (TIGR01490 family)
MSRPFAVFDIDGTVVRWQLYHAMADNLLKQGFITATDFEPARIARMDWKRRSGEDSFKAYEVALVQVFDSSLKGLPTFALESAAQAVFGEYKDQLYIYTRDIITQLKKQKYTLFAISGSPEIIVKKFAEYIGFNDYRATDYPSSNGYYTGKQLVSIGKKAALLQDLVAQHGLNFTDSVAVGDSDSDIPMLELCERPIVFNPTKGLFDHAKKQGWEIVIERKNVVYNLTHRQGRYQLD